MLQILEVQCSTLYQHNKDQAINMQDTLKELRSSMSRQATPMQAPSMAPPQTLHLGPQEAGGQFNAPIAVHH